MSQLRWDVLRLPGARWLLARAWLPVGLQAVALVVLGALVVNGWGVGQDATPARLLTLRKTNLTTLFVWGLFWPGLVVLTLLVGRVWCTVCPLELMSRGGGWLGRRLGLAGLAVPPWLRAGWAAVLGYGVLQLFVAGVALHRVPHFTSLMLLALGGLAVVAGVALREPRAFCATLCPVAPLLGVYGRFTPVQLEVRDAAVCASCASRDCVRAEHRARFDRRSCPSLLQPHARGPSDGCVLCLQCAKVCPTANVGFGVAAATATVRRPALLRPAEAAFVAIAAGFVIRELMLEVKWLERLFAAVPTAISTAVHVGFGWIEALWFLVLVPAALWGLLVLLGRVLRDRGGAGRLLLALTTAAAPVIVVAHMAKSLAKLGGWAGFLPLALRDPRGLATFDALGAHRLAAPGRLYGLAAAGGVVLVALAATAVVAWRRAPRESRVPARAGVAVLAALFLAIIGAWTLG
ncbi:MAG TPA: 4Fe-4S binding protein [Polyangia bacterium]